MYSALEKYISPTAYRYLLPFLKGEDVFLHIKRSRNSKWGDYRSPYGNQGHRISINGDLNPHAFLLTLCHELAHLFAWKHYGNKIKPHGREWKFEFQQIMKPLLEQNVFPPELNRHLFVHMRNPKAAATADYELLRLLKSFDKNKKLTLEDISEGQLFALSGGRSFTKGVRRRTRYVCTCSKSGKSYLIHPLAEVVLVS